MKRLLDTSAYVGFKRGNQEVIALVRDSDEIVFSMVVVGELLFGFRNETRWQKNLDDLQGFLGEPVVTLLPVTWTTADRFGRIAADLRRAGKPIPTNDIWIAAHAFESGAELVTLDKHFAHVPGLAVEMVG